MRQSSFLAGPPARDEGRRVLDEWSEQYDREQLRKAREAVDAGTDELEDEEDDDDDEAAQR